jgi:M6 family metalloprotease-like protein
MRRLSYLLLIVLASTISIIHVYAVKAAPYPITLTQPDGSRITVRLQGDEFFHYKTTTDGYPLTTNEKGILTYAKIDTKGKLISTNVKASNIDKRLDEENLFIQTLTPTVNFNKINLARRAVRSSYASTSTIAKISPQKSYPLTGSPRSLVILVNFSDKSFVTSTPQTAFTNLLNQAGYNTNGGTGSARDFFMSSSYGKFSPDFDVVGPVTLPQPLNYYGQNDIDGNDSLAVQMIVDACTQANKAGLDFSQYDTDNDGILDNVFVYYAGYNEAEGAATNTIWPHRWAVYPGASGNYSGSVASITFDGKILRDYACTSELKGTSGSNMCGVGTFCHEFGHVLGLDDLYNTSDSNKKALETWDIMDGGPYNNSGRTPPTYSVYERFCLGYLTPQEINTPADLTLLPIYQEKTQPANTNNQAYLMSATTHNLNGASPNPSEFFMVEYRKKTGWDTYLPAEGMLIWHIDYDQTAWSNNTPNNYSGTIQTAASHMRVYLQPLFGSTTTPGTAFTTGSFTPTTWSGVNINRAITDITKTTDNVTFKFMGGGDEPTITTDSKLTTFETVQGTPSAYQVVLINAKKLDADLNLSFVTNLHFEISDQFAPDTVWTKSLSIKPGSDSTINNFKLLVRYNPTEPSFSANHTDALLLSSANAGSVQVNLTGNSTRAVYVKPPIAKDASDVSIASFVAHWDEVCNQICDASGYYLTVYNATDGKTEYTEGFNNGLTAPSGWTINATAISTSTLYSGDSVPSIRLQNTGDLIQTEKYLLPVTNLSFFVKSLAGINGYLIVNAWNDTIWDKIDSIPVLSILNTTETYSFNTGKNYTQFRLTYTKVIGSVVIDDIVVGIPEKLEYNLRDKWVTSTSDTIINLVSNRDYYYKVKASDKTLDTDGSIKYENITNFSNLIQTKTSENNTKTNSLFASVDKNGIVTIILPSTDVILNIYNIIGQQVRSISSEYNVIKIDDLPRKQAYILQAGNLRAKVVL